MNLSVPNAVSSSYFIPAFPFHLPIPVQLAPPASSSTAVPTTSPVTAPAPTPRMVPVDSALLPYLAAAHHFAALCQRSSVRPSRPFPTNPAPPPRVSAQAGATSMNGSFVAADLLLEAAPRFDFTDRPMNLARDLAISVFSEYRRVPIAAARELARAVKTSLALLHLPGFGTPQQRWQQWPGLEQRFLSLQLEIWSRLPPAADAAWLDARRLTPAAARNFSMYDDTLAWLMNMPAPQFDAARLYGVMQVVQSIPADVRTGLPDDPRVLRSAVLRWRYPASALSDMAEYTDYAKPPHEPDDIDTQSLIALLDAGRLESNALGIARDRHGCLSSDVLLDRLARRIAFFDEIERQVSRQLGAAPSLSAREARVPDAPPTERIHYDGLAMRNARGLRLDKGMLKLPDHLLRAPDLARAVVSALQRRHLGMLGEVGSVLHSLESVVRIVSASLGQPLPQPLNNLASVSDAFMRLLCQTPIGQGASLDPLLLFSDHLLRSRGGSLITSRELRTFIWEEVAEVFVSKQANAGVEDEWHGPKAWLLGHISRASSAETIFAELRELMDEKSPIKAENVVRHGPHGVTSMHEVIGRKRIIHAAKRVLTGRWRRDVLIGDAAQQRSRALLQYGGQAWLGEVCDLPALFDEAQANGRAQSLQGRRRRSLALSVSSGRRIQRILNPGAHLGESAARYALEFISDPCVNLKAKEAISQASQLTSRRNLQARVLSELRTHVAPASLDRFILEAVPVYPLKPLAARYRSGHPSNSFKPIKFAWQFDARLIDGATRFDAYSNNVAKSVPSIDPFTVTLPRQADREFVYYARLLDRRLDLRRANLALPPMISGASRGPLAAMLDPLSDVPVELRAIAQAAGAGRRIWLGADRIGWLADDERAVRLHADGDGNFSQVHWRSGEPIANAARVSGDSESRIFRMMAPPVRFIPIRDGN